jgi:hypothetical protein
MSAWNCTHCKHKNTGASRRCDKCRRERPTTSESPSSTDTSSSFDPFFSSGGLFSVGFDFGSSGGISCDGGGGGGSGY